MVGETAQIYEEEMTKHKISVIIPLYNKESIVERSVDSVLKQSFSDFELIIVDDGSTDNSLSVVKAINDSRIRIIEQENGGPSKARNAGVLHATSEWILFLDADDELLPGALEHLISLTKTNKNIDVFCCEYVIKDIHSTVLAIEYNSCDIKNNYKALYLRKIDLRTGAALLSTEIARKNLFDERIRRFEDLEQILRLLNEARVHTSQFKVFQLNMEFSSASKARTNIKEDFIGHLNFKGKSFWERMCLYQFYLSERPHYKGQVEMLYPTLKYRYDLLLIYKLLRLFK